MDIFAEIKSRVGIMEVAAKYCRGQPVKKGKSYWIVSPFKDEKTPSCELILSTNSFRCFATDQKGDFITLVALMYEIKNYEAAKMIASDFGIPVESGEIPPKKAKAIADEQRRKLELEKRAKFLIDTLEVFYHKAVEQFKLYDGMLRELGHFDILKPDDELLKDLILGRNKWEEILLEFINGDIKTRYALFIKESEALMR